jgi:nucleoside-diphosphate-sugar epimerase
VAILVTGGAGFVGSHLVDRLCERGTVVVFDNMLTGRLSNLADALHSGRAIFAYQDVAQPAVELAKALREATPEPITEIYHFASPASPDAYGRNPWATLAVNGYGTMQLLDLAVEFKAKLLFASTSEIYGDPLVHPQPETYFGNVNPIGPRACYDEGKRFGEAAVSVASVSRGVDARIIRIFNCYGPRMQTGDGRLIPSLLGAAHTGKPLPLHGDGSQTRSMTYVSDLIDGIVCVMDAPIDALHPVNLGMEEEYSVREIAEIFSRVTGINCELEFREPRPEDPQRRKPVIAVARSLGWEPKVQLEQGLRLTYDWYLTAIDEYALT